MVREATTLSLAGHEVVVITPRFLARWVQFDDSIARQARWRYRYIDFLSRRLYWHAVRVRRRISAEVAKVLPGRAVVAWACQYANPELASMVAAERADLYVAHQHHALPAAWKAARKTGARLGFDAQDLLLDSSAEPAQLIRRIEAEYIHRCAYVSTMSAAAAERIRGTNDINAPVLVLHNTPSLLERAGVAPPEQRTRQVPSIYWFGQNIGEHSRAIQVVRALPRLVRPMRFVLRGGPTAHLEQVLATASALNVRGLVEIEPPADPSEMVRLASHHDVLLGSQPGQELYNQMAIGNKVFTGMMAGLALALTDTIAHRRLLSDAPGCGFLFRDMDEADLANQLNRLLSNADLLDAMRSASWRAAEAEFNWEAQSRPHLAVVESMLATPR